VTDKAAILSGLAQTMARQSPSMPLADRLCASAVALLGVVGASITLAYTSQERLTLCSTDDTAARLEDMQEVLGQGPGWLAYDSGEQQWVRVISGREPRWPEFNEAAHAGFGAVCICALPLRPDKEVLGVLTCHLHADGAVLLDKVHAQFLANAVGAALLRESPVGDEGDASPWSSRAEIHQATGMVVAQLHIGVEDAVALLRAHAYAAEKTLSAIANDVVERRFDFRTEDPSDTEGPS
jgi:hypothetical protein